MSILVTQGNSRVFYMSEGLFEKKIDQHIMPKITYPRPCPSCGKEVPSTFSYHKKQCDTIQLRYQCLLRPVSFSCPSSRQYHVRQQPNNERFHDFMITISCTFCGNVFTKRQHLKDHTEKKHGEGRARSHCPKCQKQFKKKDGNFYNHIKYCGRRFSCPHCPETCCNPSNLNRHIRNLHPVTLNGGCCPTLVQRPAGTKRTAEDVFHDDVLVEPSPKKLLREDLIIPPPLMFRNDSNSIDYSIHILDDWIVPPPPMFMEPEE